MFFCLHPPLRPGIVWPRLPILEVKDLISSLHAALVGGDARQRYLSEFLTQDGHTVTEFALDSSNPAMSGLSEASCVILPVPVTRDGKTLFAPLSPHSYKLDEVLDALSENQHIFGGGVTPALCEMASARNLIIQDYMSRSELAVANAVPTAEGAVQLAMERLPITIHNSRVMIAGFGRVGQCTAARFTALGAHVTVMARSTVQRALANSMGCAVLHPGQLEIARQSWDLVVNTVPAPILQKPQLAALGTPVLLELASAPGGFDLEAAQALGLAYIPAPGLPGKVAPATAARIIRDTLYAMLEEAGV